MILILKLDLQMVKMYHHTKNKVSVSNASKVVAQTDKQTHIEIDRRIHMQTLRKHYLYRIRGR